MKKRTPEEKARKEAEDIAAAVEAVENIKKPIRACLSFIVEKIANFINRIKKRKGDSAKDWVWIGEKIGEGLRAGAGIEETPHYKIMGVDLAEPEQWPKENPFINLKLLPEIPEIKETDNIINFVEQAAEVERQARKAADGIAALAYALGALPPIIERIAETLPPIIEAIADVMEQIIDLYPNKRVVHLAKHAKKERVRKKNINRIIAWYLEADAERAENAHRATEAAEG